MGTMEGFLLGTALAPQPGYDSGPVWEETAEHNRMAALAWKAEAEKLSAKLDKEHKRFLIERRERRSYMRGWAVRGAALRDECGYTKEMIAETDERLNEHYDERLTEIVKETDAEIDAEAGF